MSGRSLILGNNPLLRDVLANSLLSLRVFAEVVTVASSQELFAILKRDTAFELLIIDQPLADMTGEHGVGYLCEHYADIPIVVFSAFDSQQVIDKCFQMGARAFVAKSSSMQTIIDAIRHVGAGGTYIPPAVLR